MDISTTIDDIKLHTPFYNASGVHCTSYDELNNLNSNKYCGAIITKSCTLNFRKGNPEPRYYADEFGSINSSGLPNNGYEYYSNWIYNTQLNKHCFLSTSPMSSEELTKIATSIFNSSWIEYPEFNLSCPNIIGTMQLGYNAENSNEHLRKITEIMGNKSFGVKLPPYFEEYNFNTMADIIKQYSNIKFLTCINSIGNGLMIDTNTETVKILPKNGLGGIGRQILSPCST